VIGVDEGQPIAYQVLEDGVAVLGSEGQQIGTVTSVLSEPAEDIFHGLLISTPHHGIRFVEASVIASMHEHGVELRIDSIAAQNLPGPEHSPPVYNEDPSKQQRWRHWVNTLTGRSDWHRER
jgi:hypothetical protein